MSAELAVPAGVPCAAWVQVSGSVSLSLTTLALLGVVGGSPPSLFPVLRAFQRAAVTYAGSLASVSGAQATVASTCSVPGLVVMLFDGLTDAFADEADACARPAWNPLPLWFCRTSAGSRLSWTPHRSL